MIGARFLVITLTAVLLTCLAPSRLYAADRLRTFSTVVIDAGHGGQDRGGIPGNYVTEKIVNLDVAIRLQQKLRAAGLRTVMTRSSDVFIPLSGRVAAANSRSGTILVSVHFNSADNRDARGVETYFYSSSSYRLAAAVHRRVVTLAAENRGIKQRGYFVLRNCRVPAVLVECGFLTNRQDGRLALDSRYRDRLASAIASGIIAARRGSY